MAVVGTNTQTLSGGSFQPLYTITANLRGAPTADGFNPWPSPSASYLQRVWDSGTLGWCYYEKNEIDPTPLSTETTPNYTGAISSHSIVKETQD
jgi:hypothetical protein